MRKVIFSLAGAAFSFAAGGFAFAADMAVKASPPAPAPVPTWTGFYGGIQFGGGWNDESVGYSANDLLSAQVISGTLFGGQPIPALRIPQSGLVGGVEAGYNWQWSNWVLGIEADFSLSGMSGTASGTSIFSALGPVTTQAAFATQDTDWYGTVRGRLGWLATQNLLLFGTGGFAYGRVDGSANSAFNEAGAGPGNTITLVNPNGPPFFGTTCLFFNAPCYSGSSAEIRTGWTAGGGAEYLLDQHWSAKIEYQFVDLGTETVRLTAPACDCLVNGVQPGLSSFNAAFHDRFNVVRLGLNYRF